MIIKDSAICIKMKLGIFVINSLKFSWIIRNLLHQYIPEILRLKFLLFKFFILILNILLGQNRRSWKRIDQATNCLFFHMKEDSKKIQMDLSFLNTGLFIEVETSCWKQFIPWPGSMIFLYSWSWVLFLIRLLVLSGKWKVRLEILVKKSKI